MVETLRYVFSFSRFLRHKSYMMVGFIAFLFLFFFENSYAQVTKSVTVYSSVDGQIVDLAPINFTAADFASGFTTVSKVEVSILWTKTDRTCSRPRSGNAYHREVSFKLKGPNGVEVNLAPPSTWGGGQDIDYVTTVFSDDAASFPSGIPVSGTFAPAEALSGFNGIYALGNWVLIAGDSANSDPLCVQSYSITLTTSNTILCTAPTLPLDNAAEVETSTALSWSAISGAIGYYLYLGTDVGATNIENGLDVGNVTTYTPSSNLNAGTDYYWKVVPYNSNGASSGCNTWSFITKDYCEAGSWYGNAYVTKVEIGDINKVSGSSSYSDFTGLSTNLLRGETKSIVLNMDNTGAALNRTSIAVWIDWNRDGAFSFAERVICLYGVNVTNSFSITVPVTASLGDTRMRVRSDYNWGGRCASPCDESRNGETEDYSLHICGPPIISEQPSSSGEILCIGESAAELNIAASGVDLSYQWYSNTSPSTTGGTLIEGATSSKYTPLANAIGTLYYYCVVKADCNLSVTSNVSGAIVVTPKVVPTFTQIGTICSGGSFTLPTTSTNGITGTWSPAINNTATTEYTFTPNAGECATATTMTVPVNAKVTPSFTQVSPICSGDSFTLPTTSTNGITGTWSPAINNIATTEYTFTPNTGECATTTTMTVTVNAKVIPSFTQVSPICSGGSFVLPTTSINGISGTWSPAINNTVTTEYTFTPNPGECATPTTMTVTVHPKPTISITNNNGPICIGDTAKFTVNASNSAIGGRLRYQIGVYPAATVLIEGNLSFFETKSTQAGDLPLKLLSIKTKEGCEYTLTNTATVTVNSLPNNTSSGFLGSIICQGEQATLKFDAEDATFSIPYSIRYTDGTTIWTQSISSASEETFNVIVNPINPGSYNYSLVSIVNGDGCERTADFGNSMATVTVRENPALVIAMTLNKNTVCIGDTSPVVTFTNSDTKPIIVSYTVNGGTPLTIEVPRKVGATNGSATVNVATTTAGVYTYNATKVRYKSSPNCETNINLSQCIAVFPNNSTAPIVNSGTGTPIIVSSPTAATGFIIQYSFDDGTSWEPNTPPTADNCAGYKIRTRYVLANACGTIIAGSTISCAVSPATIRVVDTTAPTFYLLDTPLSVCVADISNASYTNTTNGDVNDPPDYYEFAANDTALDISNLQDNCCTATPTISWSISPASKGVTISGTGQPSQSIGGKKFWLNISTVNPKSSYTQKTYTITYQVTDCNGNTVTQTRAIIVKPRPKINKVE